MRSFVRCIRSPSLFRGRVPWCEPHALYEYISVDLRSTRFMPRASTTRAAWHSCSQSACTLMEQHRRCNWLLPHITFSRVGLLFPVGRYGKPPTYHRTVVSILLAAGPSNSLELGGCHASSLFSTFTAATKICLRPERLQKQCADFLSMSFSDRSSSLSVFSTAQSVQLLPHAALLRSASAFSSSTNLHPRRRLLPGSAFPTRRIFLHFTAISRTRATNGVAGISALSISHNYLNRGSIRSASSPHEATVTQSDDWAD